MPDDMARPLPYRDIHALFDVVVVFGGELLSGEAPSEMVDRILRRMTADGFLPSDASAGELAATIGDLIQRLHYAMGAGDVLPEFAPRVIWHSLRASTQQAALTGRAALTDLGSSSVVVRELEPGVWEALAAFPELPPDLSFSQRVDQLQNLAERQRIRYAGWQS